MIKIVILNDSKNSRDILESFASFTEFISEVMLFDDYRTFMHQVEKLDYDVVFCSLDSFGCPALEFLMDSTSGSKVVGVSSKLEDAVKSYDYGIADFLIKPIKYDRFLKSIERVTGIDKDHDHKGLVYGSSIFIKTRKKFIRIEISKVRYVEACGDYVNIHTTLGKHTVLSTMKSIHSQIGTRNFIRVHRSYIVALDKIDSYSGSFIKMGNETLRVSKTFRANLKYNLNLVSCC